MEKQTIKELAHVLRSRLDRPMRYYLDTCTRCGVCLDACHVYQGIRKIEYTPVGRAETVRKLYRRYARPAGLLFPYWGEAKPFTEQAMDEVREAALSCTGCRRCAVNCPFGIDTGLIMSLAKHLLVTHGSAPEELVMLADAAVEKGKSIEDFKEGYRSVIRDLEKEVQARLRLPSSEGLIPLDKKGAEILYVGLAGAHSIVNPAIIFTAAKENWTLSYFEAVNFGYFAGDPHKANIIARRIIDEATGLGVREVVIVECGTAFRILRALMGKLPFKVSSIVEVVDRYVREGRIRLREGAVAAPMTYHDPCQLGRSGGVYDEPRRIIRAVAKDFREMTPNREQNWCCGGGGGLMALDNEEFRIRSGLAKKDQILATGASIVVTACENCVTQLSTIASGYGLNVEVKYLTGLVCENLAV